MGCGHRVDSLSKRTLVGRFKNHAVMTAWMFMPLFWWHCATGYAFCSSSRCRKRILLCRKELPRHGGRRYGQLPRVRRVLSFPGFVVLRQV
jgi:hypothetical protein